MTDSIPWTSEQALALAPDGQVAKAASGLARPGKWRRTGRSGEAVWGEQQGSGANPYRVAVALDGPAFKCSCPSRKRPCKHALGLLLLACAEPATFAGEPAPPWLVEWLAGRAARPRPTSPAARKADPQAQARRAAQRERLVAQGVQALDLWLEDLVRQGLGALPGRPASFWQEQAARLVDAQAPGLARRLRELAALPASGEGWPARMLDRLARLHLLLEGYRRLDRLPAELQAEVREQVGWTQDQAALRREPGRSDCWAVVGRWRSEEDRLRVQRTWLWGLQGQMPALLLDFAVGDRPFDSSLLPGTAFEGELVFWPGPQPLRALVKEGRPVPLTALPGYPTLEAALAAYGAALARNPWLERLLLPLEGVRPLRRGEGWAVCDAAGGLLPLALPDVEGWRLLALGGGRPLTLAAEWDGERLWPLSAWTGGELVVLGGRP